MPKISLATESRADMCQKTRGLTPLLDFKGGASYFRLKITFKKKR